MIIALDLTWMSIQNKSGGIFQYGIRVLTALVRHSSHSIVAIVSEGCEGAVSDLADAANFKLVVRRKNRSFTKIIKNENIDVIHTPFQYHVNFTLAAPMISTLHDLQQFHYPEFFSPDEIESRNVYYRKSAEFSERIIVTFQHVKDDIVKFYGIPPDKIDVCAMGMPEAKPLNTEFIETVKRKYDLPEKYLFYSANTWRHKNHLGLIRGLKLLHEKHDVKVPLICTGFQYPDFFPQIEDEISRLDLVGNVRFLGYLPDETMPAVLCGAALSVIPTLYEAGSFPLMEAMNHGVPVICSTATSLPATIGDRRFVFDPNSPEQMAEQMAIMLTDEKMRRENIVNSATRVKEWRWEKAVTSFLESYQKAIDGYDYKKKYRWYSDWTINYEIMAMRINSKLRRKFAFYSDKFARERDKRRINLGQ
ncbi:MAG: glycosyltransferase family 1 protein [Geobacteraceae bacterium]|nr:glycosyltransferase family 1 protein [Geobacteraceae bacterium]